MMQHPYEPRTIPSLHPSLNQYYKTLGVTSNILIADAGYVLAMYIDGQHIGGLRELGGAIDDKLRKLCKKRIMPATD